MFKFYKSHTQLSGSVVEAGANDIKPIWQHWSFIGAAICLVVFVLMIPSLKNPLKPPQLEITENELLQSENPVKTYPQVDQAKQKTPTAEAMEIRANAIAQERIKKIQTELDDYKRREESMPFHDVQLHIRGSVRGVRNGLKRQIYHISASQNGQHVFTLYDRELTQAGYELDPMGDCLLFITHSGITKELTCNAPTIQVTGT
jgi:zona occludens toxin